MSTLITMALNGIEQKILREIKMSIVITVRNTVQC